MNASELDDPDFWRRFFESVHRLPTGSDREYELLAKIAARAGVSYSFARQRVRDYLAGRLAKPPPISGEGLINPYAPNPHRHRGNNTIH